MSMEISTHRKFKQLICYSNLLVEAVLMFVIMYAIPILSTPPAGSAWQLNWSDDFDGTSYNTANWGLMYTIASEQVRASQITVANGICTFTGAKQGSTYISGGLTSTDKHMNTYGYWEIRAKLPQSPGGTWPAIWLPGCNGDWHPEIDIVDGTSSTCYWRAAHWDFGSGDQQNADGVCPEGGITADYHTYGMQWTKDSIMWYYDDMKMRSVATAGMNFPGCPLPLIINLQLGGWGGGTIDDSKLPFYMQIDWVKMWQINTNTTDPVIGFSPSSIDLKPKLERVLPHKRLRLQTRDMEHLGRFPLPLSTRGKEAGLAWRQAEAGTIRPLRTPLLQMHSQSALIMRMSLYRLDLLLALHTTLRLPSSHPLDLILVCPLRSQAKLKRKITILGERAILTTMWIHKIKGMHTVWATELMSKLVLMLTAATI